MSRNASWVLSLSVACCVFLALQACAPDTPTAPPEGQLLAARGGSGSGGGGGGGKTTTEIKVSALDPDTVPADTVLTIRVLGSGFTAGSQVSWALAGTPTTEVATTGPVTYVSSKELRAPVTIQPDAPLTSYDVVVTAAGGKKGIGVELLEVVAKPILLPEPDGVLRSEAHDVNDAGVIVGWGADAADNFYALRWTPAGDTWVVEALGAGSAVAINDDGHIVRRHYDASSGVFHSWVVTPSGGEVYVGEVYVNDISAAGTLIGSIRQGSTFTYVAWRRLSASTWGPPIVLPELAGYANSDLNGIGDGDDIAGHVFDNAGHEWPVVWTYGAGQWSTPVLVDPVLGGAAMAINAHGTVAGAVWPCWDPNGGCPSRPAFWPAVGSPRQLLADPYYGVYSGWITAYVNDMNNSNRIVGWARVPAGRRNTNTHAVVWYSPSAVEPTDLGAAVAAWFSEAMAINDAGLAVGYGRQPSGPTRAMAWRLP